MTNKEKMIEVFGEDSLKDLIKAIKPTMPSASIGAYARFLEWLLEEYKEPVKKEEVQNEEPFMNPPTSSKYPWGDKKDTMTIHSEEYDTDVEVPVKWTVAEIMDFKSSNKQFWVIKTGQAIRHDTDRYSYNEKTQTTLQKMRYDFTTAIADLNLQNDISVHVSQAKGGIVLERVKA